MSKQEQEQEQFEKWLLRFGQAVRHHRLSRGVTQEVLADSIDVGSRHLQKIEAGEVNTTVRTIFRLASALGVPPAEFFCREDNDG